MKSKEGPIHAARRINIKALCMFRFLAKRPLKNLEKSSERTRPGYPEAARCSRFSGRVAQLKWVETAQKGYHEIQEMKNRYVILKHPVVQQRTRKLGE